MANLIKKQKPDVLCNVHALRYSLGESFSIPNYYKRITPAV